MGEYHESDLNPLPSLQEISLSDWKALNWSPVQVQHDNLKTLVDIWPSLQGSQEQDTKWGDEIEYVLLKLDHHDRYAKVSPKATDVIEKLSKHENTADAVDVQREAYEYMVETSPLKPYPGELQQLTKVESNMTQRRKMIQRQLDPSTAVFSLSRFGMFGALHCQTPDGAATPEAVKEEAGLLVTQGARYRPVLEAISKRRGHNMNGEVYLYDNTASMSASVSSLSSDSISSSSSDSITVDDPIYAVGGCAVQVNFGMKSLTEALYLHDQFCPVGPLMVALTAASPILKGCLIDTDARWDHCVQANDDRSPEESHLFPRWGTSPMYFQDLESVQSLNRPLTSKHEGVDEFAAQLQQVGLPTPLATYYAHALNRDPMLHPKSVPGTTQDGDLNDRIVRLKTHMSALWPHIRLKLPSTDGTVPWIVEFRSMETQPTDFEIAAIVVFLRLLQQTILHYKLELRVPMILVEENMSRAQGANAVEQQKFWFNVSNTLPSGTESTTTNAYELTLNETFNGQTTSSTSNTAAFPGLLHHVRSYLAEQAQATNLSSQDLAQLESYLQLVSRRASGEEPTPAKWMRDFVMRHPDYNGDSRVSQQMYYEMLCEIGQRSKVWA